MPKALGPIDALCTVLFVTCLVLGGIVSFQLQNVSVEINHNHQDDESAPGTSHEVKGNLPVQIDHNAVIAQYTKWLAYFTAALVATSFFQVLAIAITNRLTRRSADAARDSADAAIAVNLPFLSITGGIPNSLHPLQSRGTGASGEVAIELSIENNGPTPADVIEFRADIVVITGGDVPTQDLSTLTEQTAIGTIPGNSGGSKRVKARVASTYSLTENEFQELLAAAIPGPYKRFWIIGRIVFNDYFGLQHTMTFARKLRWFLDAPRGRPQFFCEARGRPEQNTTTRKKMQTTH